MGLFATGSSALGFSSGLAVNVGKDDPGPQRMRACSPGEAEDTACGIVRVRVGWASQDWIGRIERLPNSRCVVSVTRLEPLASLAVSVAGYLKSCDRFSICG